MLKKLFLAAILFQFAFTSDLHAQTQGCPAVIDQQLTSFNQGTYGADQWQSFVAGMSGDLVKVEFMTNGNSSGTQPYTFTIQSGQGLGGTVLYQNTGTFNTVGAAFFAMNIPPGAAQVTSGLTYTCRIQISGAYSQLACNNANAYPNGIYYSDVYGQQNTWDLNFKTTVVATTYPPATMTPGGPLQFCQGGSVLFTANSGGSLAYQWENNASPIGGATGINYSANISGNYTVKVTNTTTNCWNTSAPYTVTVDPLPVITLTTTNVSCNGASNGSVSSTVSSGTPGYSYTWSPGGATTANISGLSAGTYTLTVADSKGCTAGQAATVNQPALLTVSATSTGVSCFGGSNGTATATATGGTGPYNYSWSPSGGTTNTATGLAAGTYSCYVTDINGCVASTTVNVNSPSLLNSTSTKTDVTCFGAANGSATVTATGGTPSYIYSWAPSGGTGATATGLSAGTHTCTITDANSCVATQTVIITQPTALSASLSSTDVSCFGGTNGTASVSATGGTPAFSFSWAPSGSSLANPTGLSAGTHTCTVTDGNGCVATQTVIVNEPALLSTIATPTDASCFGSANGSATVTATGGTLPYAYSWSPSGGTTNTATGLTAGNYTCTVTDANACVATQTVIINEPALLSTIATPTDASCFGSANGSATVTATGGTLPYAYSWSPSGGTTNTATGLTAGNYTCTVTDANACVATQTVIVNEPALLSTIATPTDATCFGSANGSATVTATGGTLPYAYSWSPSGGTTNTATGLTAGNYTCTVTDANACVATQTVTVNEPALITSSSSQTNVSCNAGNDGSASVTVTGGTPAYTFAWSSGGTSATETGLAAGNYTCTITDANGCTDVQLFTITEPNLMSVSSTQTDVSCNGLADGSASVTVTGGTPSYSYSWSSGGTTATETGLAFGTYTCNVTDANGCTGSVTVNINEPAAITVSQSQTNATCNGLSDGSATATVSGGTLPYSYSWSTGGTAATETGLSAGVHTCTVTDANNCTTAATFTITAPAALSLSASQTNAACYGVADGSATITASGGTAPYTYSWSPGSNLTATASSLAAGTYICTVTDAGGCSAIQTVVITEPAAISISLSTVPTVCGANNGSATATVSGGTAPFIYQWSNGSITNQADSLFSGQYLIQVYDANSCYASAIAIIASGNGPALTPTVSNVTCAGGNDGAVSVSVNGGVTPYTYEWSTGALTSSIGSLSAGVYDLTVEDASGCKVVTAFTVTEPAPLSVSFSATDANCGLADGNLTANVTGGTGAYTYLWSVAAGSQTTATAGNLAAGVYPVTVTDAAACSATAAGIVNNIASTLSVSISSITSNDCGATANGAVSTAVTGGTAPITYLWSNGANTAAITGVATGTYYVTATDANNCASSASATVNSAIAGTYQPEICIVTVDTASHTNFVIWEKPAMNGISHYKIYRETSLQNAYINIGSVPFDSLSQFEDMDVADPNVKSWRYKISAVDSCGVETPLSTSHKTIHLTQTEGTAGSFDLSWDFYSGFNYVTFYVWRNDPSTGWMLIDSLPSAQYTYTDATPPSTDAVYMIEVQQVTSCNPTRALINTSRSNIKAQIANPLGVSSTGNNILSFGAFPNPASDLLNVHVNLAQQERISLKVYDALGQIVYNKTFDAKEVKEIIPMYNFASGVYFVQLQSSEKLKTLKVLKQ